MATIKKDSFEKTAWASNSLICGIDEVGRGCLAGPLVTAAVVLHPGKRSRLLKDSKVLTKPELLKAAAWIFKNSYFSYGIVSSHVVDRVNIYQATLLAMKRAVVTLMTRYQMRPSAVLVDAMPLAMHDTPFGDVPIHSFAKAESKSSSVAAASIIAKVKRDQLMANFDSLFPQFGFARHVGYSTQIHQAAVLKHGHSVIHRISFLHKLHQKAVANEKQQRIC